MHYCCVGKLGGVSDVLLRVEIILYGGRLRILLYVSDGFVCALCSSALLCSGCSSMQNASRAYIFKITSSHVFLSYYQNEEELSTSTEPYSSCQSTFHGIHLPVY